MSQALRTSSSNVLFQDPVPFSQQRGLTLPLRTGSGGGVAPAVALAIAAAKPQAAYTPFSLGFQGARPTKQQPQALLAYDGTPTNQPPLKNTFIHFDVPDSRVSTLTKEQIERWGSAPGMIQTAPWKPKYPEMETAHIRNECKPCAYHFQKVDGCRWGDQCTFCHLCPTGEIKRRKKEKVQAIKIQGRSKNGEPRGPVTKNL